MNKIKEMYTDFVEDEEKVAKVKDVGKKTLIFGVPFVALTAVAYYGIKSSKDVDYLDYTEE